MKEVKNKSALVVFGKDLPKNSKKWWQQRRFDEIIGPKELKNFVKPGSIQEAYHLVNQIPILVTPDGKKVSKLINYKGYDLWWLHYEDIFEKFCLPYTQYKSLLEHLKDFEKVYLFQPPQPHLFHCFLKTHHCQCIIFKRFQFRKLFSIPFGVFIQIVISLISLPWLMISRPRLMIWASDKFNLPYKRDFRATFVYKELFERKIAFAEFMRSMESWSTVLIHAWKRKKPVFYSTAIIFLIQSFANLFRQKKEKELNDFWLKVATYYLPSTRGNIWAIQAMKFILRGIGVKSAIIYSACNRNFHEVLGCKLAGIKTVGIQHGASPGHDSVSDFMPGFDGKLLFSVDRYGLWSNWWKEYYISHSRAFKPEQLYVSGPMRPLKKEIVSSACPKLRKGPLAVLFISEELAVPAEVMPYFLALLENKDFDLYVKFRPYRDGFEEWLKENQPQLLEKIKKRTKILRGTVEEAVKQCDVVVGSHSTAVLEASLQLKPFVFFRTFKWGDNYGIKPLDPRGRFFAENPKELIDCVRKSSEVPKEDLKQLQERFFGNPYQNGSKWVVEQAIKFLEKNKKQ